MNDVLLRDHVDGCHNKADVHARYAMFSDKFGEPCDCPKARIPIDTERMSLRQLHAALQPEIEALDDSLEYVSLDVATKYERPSRLDQPIGRYRWIACYAVTGGSEGHYVHVDRIWAEPYGADQREPIMLVKTFGGWARACAIAALLGERLGA